MKRILGVLLCVVLVFTTMAGCGKEKSNDNGFKLASMTSAVSSTNIMEYKEEVRELAEAGFKYIDLSLYKLDYNSFWMKEGWEKYANELKTYADEQGVTFIQSHLPSWNPVDKKIWGLVHSAYTIRAIEVCAVLGIENAVIHPGSVAGLTEKEAYFETLKEGLSLLFPVIEKHNINLLIENTAQAHCKGQFNFFTGAGMKEFLDYLNHPNVHAVWDTGHGNMEGHQYEDIIALGEYLKGVHIHNNNGSKDEHLFPLMGNMDLDGIMKGLVEINYQGYFTLEVDNYDQIDVEVCKEGTGKDPKFKKALKKMRKYSDEPRKCLYEVTKECLLAYDLFQE